MVYSGHYSRTTSDIGGATLLLISVHSPTYMCIDNDKHEAGEITNLSVPRNMTL